MSRARLAVAILVCGAAALFAYQAVALDRRPLAVMGVAATTDEKRVLEMADALDELGKMGYSDGHGNRMAVGEGFRELVRKRRQERLMYWSTAGVLALIGVVAVAKRRKAVSLMVGVFVLLTVGCAR